MKQGSDAQSSTAAEEIPEGFGCRKTSWSGRTTMLGRGAGIA